MAQTASLLYRRLAIGELCERPRTAKIVSFHGIVWPANVNADGRNPGLERVKFSLRTTAEPDKPPNSLRRGVHSRGYLPHVKREGASCFVTFRLVDSLPKEVLLRFEGEHAEALRRLPAHATSEQTEEVHRELRRKVERYLDQGAGECHLRRPEIADTVAPFSSRVAALALEIYDGMAGKLLALPGIGKEAMHVMSTRGGQLIFDAPDFLEHQIGALCVAIKFHGGLAASPLVGFGGQLHEGMAGFQFAFARLGKQLVEVVAVFGGKSVLRAPHFAEHQVAGRLCGRNVSHFAHGRFPSILPACKSPEG